LRLWSQYRQGKTRKKLNICRRMMTMTSRGKKTMRKEKDEMFHDADEIKTFRDEAPIPSGRLRDLLNHINITTPPKFRIKRISRPGREEYKAIVEIISEPNVLSRHKGPAFRTT
jgi:hypothetical protein